MKPIAVLDECGARGSAHFLDLTGEERLVQRVVAIAIMLHGKELSGALRTGGLVAQEPIDQLRAVSLADVLVRAVPLSDIA